MGEKQDLDLLLRTARLMLDEPDVHFFVFGDGAVRDRFVETRDRWRLSNVTLFPFQGRELVPHILHGADALLVSQRKEVVDIVVPSKLITAMAAGAMIVAACSKDSETAALVDLSGGGIVLPAGDEDALATTLRRIKSGEEDVERHRHQVRRFAQSRFDCRAVYASVIESFCSLAAAKANA